MKLPLFYAALVATIIPTSFAQSACGSCDDISDCIRSLAGIGAIQTTNICSSATRLANCESTPSGPFYSLNAPPTGCGCASSGQFVSANVPSCGSQNFPTNAPLSCSGTSNGCSSGPIYVPTSYGCGSSNSFNPGNVPSCGSNPSGPFFSVNLPSSCGSSGPFIPANGPCACGNAASYQLNSGCTDSFISSSVCPNCGGSSSASYPSQFAGPSGPFVLPAYGPSSSPLPTINAGTIVQPAPSRVVNLPAPPAPPVQVIANSCSCTKNVLRPQVYQRLVRIPSSVSYVKQSYVPVTQNIPYSAVGATGPEQSPSASCDCNSY